MHVTEDLQVPTDVTPRVACDRRTNHGFEQAVRQAVARTKASPLVPPAGAVHGVVFDVGTAKLNEVA
jgi:hypothetical protein